MEKKVITGYNYAATSATEATIVDDNGLVLCEVEAGKQGYFTATTDTIDVGSSDVVITQLRGNFNMPITAGGGGGGQSFPEGSIVGIGPNGASMNVANIIKINVNDSSHTTTAEFDINTITEWYGDLPITNGGTLFLYKTNLTKWHGNLPNMTTGMQLDYTGYNAHGMFQQCTALASFSGDLSSLTDGRSMFRGCTALATINTNLDALSNGRAMFYGCTGLTEWNIDLPSLTKSNEMFQGCTGLTQWTIDLPSGLSDASYMFYGCTGLTQWTIDLPSGLSDATRMFYGCTGLTEFAVDLPSGLSDATEMFERCKLNKASVQRIVDTIPDVREVSGTHKISIGIDSTQITYTEQNAFNATIVGKGWTVYWQRM